MKKIIPKLNMYISNAGVINNDIGKISLRFILGSLGMLVLLYMFLLGSMVSNILERRGLETRERVLSNEVRNLELTYLSMANNIDLEFSYSLGFKEAKANFATRKSIGFRSSDESLDNTLQNDL